MLFCALLSGKVFSDSAHYADLSLEELLNIEVTDIAGDRGKNTSQTSAVVSVVSRQEIQAMGAVTLLDVMQRIPGVSLNLDELVHDTNFTIRGGYDADDTMSLVMINGVGVDQATQQSILYIPHFPVAMIERIEVIRGPGSAVHGADAYSGLVNIVTTDYTDADDRIALTAGNGELDVQQLSWKANKRFDNGFHFNINGVYQNSYTDTFSVDTDLATILDPASSLAPADVSYPHDNVFNTLNMSWNDMRFHYSYRRTASRHGLNMGFNALAEPGDSNVRIVTHIAGFKYDNIQLHDRISMAVDAYYRRNKLSSYYVLFPRGFGGGAFPDGMIGAPATLEEQLGGGVTFRADLDSHFLTLGVGAADVALVNSEVKNFSPLGVPLGTLVDVTGTPDIFLGDVSRASKYIYLQDDMQLTDDLLWVLGVRYDDFTQFGSTTNPRTSLIYTPTDQWAWRMIYGSAFRAPSFNELFIQNNPVAAANPDLKPSTLDSLELSVSYIGEKITWSTSIYNYIMDGVMNRDPVPPRVAFNTGEREGYGLEFETRYKASSVPLLTTFNYTYQAHDDKVRDDDVGVAPTHQAYWRTDYSVTDKITAGLQVNYIGSRDQPAGDLRDGIGALTKTDLIINVQDIWPNLSANVALKNITGEDITYLTPAEYGESVVFSSDPSAYLTLEYRF